MNTNQWFTITHLPTLKVLQRNGVISFCKNEQTERFKYIDSVLKNHDNNFEYKENYVSGCFYPYLQRRELTIEQKSILNKKRLELSK
jgi:hypothetical protein